jgi:hypothetical protein
VVLIPLTGWVNVYRGDGADSRHGYFVEDCPGVVLQESTTMVRRWDEPRADGTMVPHSIRRDVERETRMVAASFDCGRIVDASEASNFDRSMSRRD